MTDQTKALWIFLLDDHELVRRGIADLLTSAAGFEIVGEAFLDLRKYASWCQGQGHLFQARRANIECFGRDMEARGRARATIARRLFRLTLSR